METGRPLSDRARTSKPARGGRREPRPSGQTLVRRRKTEQAHICLGTNGMNRTDDDRFAFSIVNAALGGSMSSRLFQEVREQRGLAYSVYSYNSQYEDAGLFTCYAGTTPKQATQVVRLLRSVVADVAAGGLTKAEFERAKGHVRGSLVLSLEDPGGRMSRLGKSELAHGEILTVAEMLRRVGRVTFADAQRVAGLVLSRPMTLTVLGPFGPGAFRSAA
jgi:predicted Zn-dependent peptidase